MEELALEAGKIAADGYMSLNAAGVRTKGTTRKDVVTEVDTRVEEFIITSILKQFPDHGIFGEENGHCGNPNSPFVWVIDPIDGTASFEHGQSFYSVSIALQKNGKSIAGVIHAPKLNELFFAEAGRGAFFNGERIHVSNRSELEESCAATGFVCLRSGNIEKNNLKTFCAIVPLLRGIRRYGSAALDMAYVACGRLEFFWEYPLNLYDVAAGTIIVREAGGLVTDYDRGNEFPQRGILCSNGLVHESIRRIILEHDYRS